jgi:hypothetical protein
MKIQFALMFPPCKVFNFKESLTTLLTMHQKAQVENDFCSTQYRLRYWTYPPLITLKIESTFGNTRKSSHIEILTKTSKLQTFHTVHAKHVEK